MNSQNKSRHNGQPIAIAKKHKGEVDDHQRTFINVVLKDYPEITSTFNGHGTFDVMAKIIISSVDNLGHKASIEISDFVSIESIIHGLRRNDTCQILSNVLNVDQGHWREFDTCDYVSIHE